MPIPTTRMQADRLLTRLRERLPSIHPELTAEIVEPTRGHFEIAVSLPAEDGRHGLVFELGALDSGSHGIAPAATHAIMTLAGHELPPLPVPTTPKTVYDDVMTTRSVHAPDPAIAGGVGSDAVLVVVVEGEESTEGEESAGGEHDEALAVMQAMVDAGTEEGALAVLAEAAETAADPAVQAAAEATVTQRARRKKDADEQAG